MDSYLLTKTLHIFFVVLWISGVFANAAVLFAMRGTPDGIGQQTVGLFHRIDKWVANPAQGFAWVFGVGLIFMGGWFPDMWLILKLICATLIAALHGVQSATLRKAANGQETKNRLVLARRFGFAAVPTLFVLIFLVVNKPF